jgi:hypothetical protein
MQSSNYDNNVFINCPFDQAYKPMFSAIVYTVHDCGFIARCALEEDDAGQIRIEKIYELIEQSRYGIHDISRVELDQGSGLPRFNMPLELGIFLGARRWVEGNKKCLVLETEQYRYQKYISDISGQDIQAHSNEPEKVTTVVRNWLSEERDEILRGGAAIWSRYQRFLHGYLPSVCKELEIEINELKFNDYVSMIDGWLRIIG